MAQPSLHPSQEVVDAFYFSCLLIGSLFTLIGGIMIFVYIGGAMGSSSDQQSGNNNVDGKFSVDMAETESRMVDKMISWSAVISDDWFDVLIKALERERERRRRVRAGSAVEREEKEKKVS